MASVAAAFSTWAHEFKWDENTFASDPRVPLAAAVIYLLLVAGKSTHILGKIGGEVWKCKESLPELKKGRKQCCGYVYNAEADGGGKPFELLPAKWVCPGGCDATNFLSTFVKEKAEIRSVGFEIVHNALLTLVSFSMFIGAIYGAWYRASFEGEGIEGLLCTERAPSDIWNGPLGAVTYVFYLTKFYEFMDTFILRFRRKPLLTLHVWHHAVMPSVCFSWFYFPWLEGSWWCTLVNSLIHTFMYSHYLATTLGKKNPFAKYMTQLQIVQFCTGIVYVLLFMQRKLAADGDRCTSDVRPAIFSTLVNVTFLSLFGLFYVNKYNKDAAKKKAAKEAKAAGVKAE